MTNNAHAAGRLHDRVALVTGAARGIGRAAAVRLAREGADVIAVDVCGDLDHVPYALAGPEDLSRTAEMISELGRRVVTCEVDVRRPAELAAAVAFGAAELDRLDIVCANAGVVAGSGATWELTEEQWAVTHQVNVDGVWNTVRSALPHLRRTGGGSVIIVGSTASFQASVGLAHYTSSAHCLDGLRKAFAMELAEFNIRVNSVNPCQVETPMVENPALRTALVGRRGELSLDAAAAIAATSHILPVPWVDTCDVAAGIAYLASEDARYVTGSALVIDAGATQEFKEGTTGGDPG